MNEITRDWLDVFEKSKRAGEELEKSVFWRLAVFVLPLGVDPEHPDVQKALAEIKAAMNKQAINTPDSDPERTTAT